MTRFKERNRYFNILCVPTSTIQFLPITFRILLTFLNLNLLIYYYSYKVNRFSSFLSFFFLTSSIPFLSFMCRNTMWIWLDFYINYMRIRIIYISLICNVSFPSLIIRLIFSFGLIQEKWYVREINISRSGFWFTPFTV